jgi:predicted PurR-regulated permease PerM
VLGLIVLMLGLWNLSQVVLVALTAIILAEGLRPAIERLHVAGLPFGLAVAVVYVVLAAALAFLITLLAQPLVSQAGQFLANLPSYQAQVQRNLEAVLNRLSISPQSATSLTSYLVGPAGQIGLQAIRFGGDVLGGILDLLTVALLSIFWLSASREFGPWVLALFSGSRREVVATLFREIGRAFAGYVRGVTINMLAIGTLAGLVTWILHLPVPVLLGVVAGLAELIPLVGPFLGAVPAVLLGFTVGPLYPLVVGAAYLALQQVESNVLMPVVMRHAVGLRAFALLLALLIGSAVAGIWGALVAVPVASAIQAVLVHVVAPAIQARDVGARPASPAQVPPAKPEG